LVAAITAATAAASAASLTAAILHNEEPRLHREVKLLGKMRKRPSGKLRIYIAGPYTPKSSNPHTAVQEVQRNVDRAIEIANALIEKGHYVFVPHLSHYIHVHYSCKRDYGEWWYELDMTFLRRWANALFYFGSSRGADRELEMARQLGLKIFRSLDEVPEVERE